MRLRIERFRGRAGRLTLLFSSPVTRAKCATYEIAGDFFSFGLGKAVRFVLCWRRSATTNQQNNDDNDNSIHRALDERRAHHVSVFRPPAPALDYPPRQYRRFDFALRARTRRRLRDHLASRRQAGLGEERASDRELTSRTHRALRRGGLH